MTTLQFVLCPDKSCARLLRRQLAEKQPSIYLQVGTWTELLALVRNSYCLSEKSNDWDSLVITAMRELEDARTKKQVPYVWSASFAIAEQAVGRLIAEQLRALLEALPPGKNLPNIKALTRAEQRVQELILLHQHMNEVLPDDLADIKSILHAKPGQSMREIQVIVATDMVLSVWQQQLIDHLNTTSANHTTIDSQWLRELIQPKLINKNALGHLQQNLFAEKIKPKALDSALQWLAVRDSLEEVEVVAGMIQQGLHDDKTLATAEIGLLIPDQAFYPIFIDEVFAKAGLPVSGLPLTIGVRDIASELLHLYLQCRQPGVTPTMAQAAFLALPIMPWSESHGTTLAQACFDDEDRLLAMADKLDEPAKRLVDQIFCQTDSSVKLLKDLQSLVTVIKNVVPDTGALSVQQRLVELIDQLAPLLQAQTPIDWPRLLKQIEPKALEQPVDSHFNQQGIAIFTANEMAWRRVKKLYVLGFVEGQYPQQASPSSFWSEAEKQSLAASHGLQWTDLETLDSYYRKRFLQQLNQASESIVFTIPLRNLAGEEQAPSVSLAYQAQLFSGINDANDLVLNLDIQSERNRVIGLPQLKTIQVAPPRTIEIKDLAFNRNLLELRLDENNQPKPESPSGLEKLLISPLAWLLSRAHIEAKAWDIRQLDVMTQGSLAHKVFECLFVANKTIPSAKTINQQLPGILDQAVEEIASFLNTSEWHLEKTLLAQEVHAAALVWQDILSRTGAKVIANEQALKGVIFTCPIRGNTDCIFQTKGGETIVVDFKKSKADSRKKRMEKGYDLQASLYREMLLGKDNDLKLKKDKVTLMYYTLNDQAVLTDKAIKELPDAQVFDDIDKAALVELEKRLKEVEAGEIKLNRQDDMTAIEKTTGIKPYALEDSPLIVKFSHAVESE